MVHGLLAKGFGGLPKNRGRAMHHQSRWTLDKINRRLPWLEALTYRSRQELEPFLYEEVEPEARPDLEASTGRPLLPGTWWGRGGVHFVLRGQFRVPSGWTGQVALHLPLGEPGDFSHPEALVYVDGRVLSACDRHHQEILLPESCRDGQWHRLAIHGWTGTGLDQDTHRPIHHDRLLMKPCAVVEIDASARAFLARARVAAGVAQALEEHDPAQGRLLNALDEAFMAVQPNRFAEARALLDRGIAKAGPPLDVTLVAAGHAHIDVAWLWTLSQTRGKAARTFHNVLALMDQFPRFHYTQSQPQLYEYVRQDHPELFERLKERVAEGRWEPIGGMWVEADANLSGPESLVRQFLLGRAWFQEHFGPEAETRVLWLPDVFGYPASLPQLIRGAGLTYFFTIKIGWSQYNKIPYDSFHWQGLDGTRVLTHFSTAPDLSGAFASTYNAEASPRQALGTWRTLRNKELQSQVLMAFGHGDGGGGPTREMIENLEEMASFPATPQARMSSVKGFFEELEAEAGPRLPVWNGELYLELHRGTYTSQSRTKRANRQCEQVLHRAEFLAARASLEGARVPRERLREAWELVCLHQFHDILPGSSIGTVYEDSQRDHARVMELGQAMVEEALGRGDLVVVNPTSFHRRELCQGRMVEAPPYSVQPLPEVGLPGGGVRLAAFDGGYRLENSHLVVEVLENGQVSSVFDRRLGRESLAPGKTGNQLLLFEDRPVNWEAWDIDIFYEDRVEVLEATSVRVLEDTPLRAILEAVYDFGESRLTQRIVLAQDSPRVDFETEVDWHERQRLLKAAFPVNVLALTSSQEIQWGYVQRTTHRNTSWDWARFETCAHKWVDLSEDDFGVSLLNDCKYGHDVRDDTMRISLLRAPLAPDPEADQGRHSFTYALMPHGVGLEDTVAQAYALNQPLLVMPGLASQGSLVATDTPSAVVETVKPSEDGRGLVVRLYQSQRRRSKVRLQAGFPLRQVFRCNLLEKDHAEVPAARGEVELEMGPFEIATFRLVPG